MNHEMKIYSIRDGKGEYFNLPFFKHTHGEAERDFNKITNDPNSMVFQYPDDYDLYFIGVLDTKIGVLTPLDTPQHIAKAINVKKQ